MSLQIFTKSALFQEDCLIAFELLLLGLQACLSSRRSFSGFQKTQKALHMETSNKLSGPNKKVHTKLLLRVRWNTSDN